MDTLKQATEETAKEKKLHKIWLAGLGAYAKSTEEVNKLSEKNKSLFDELVEQGRVVESNTKERLHTNHSHTSVAIEERVHQMMQKFVGLDNEHIDRVDDKIDQLTANIEVLLARKQEKTKPATKKAAKSNVAKEDAVATLD